MNKNPRLSKQSPVFSKHMCDPNATYKLVVTLMVMVGNCSLWLFLVFSLEAFRWYNGRLQFQFCVIMVLSRSMQQHDHQIVYSSPVSVGSNALSCAKHA
jgi:hypothetical protein